MSFDLFTESCMAYEKDNNEEVILIDKDVIKRLNVFMKVEKCEMGINEFLKLNLENMGY